MRWGYKDLVGRGRHRRLQKIPAGRAGGTNWQTSQWRCRHIPRERQLTLGSRPSQRNRRFLLSGSPRGVWQKHWSLATVGTSAPADMTQQNQISFFLALVFEVWMCFRLQKIVVLPGVAARWFCQRALLCHAIVKFSNCPVLHPIVSNLTDAASPCQGSTILLSSEANCLQECSHRVSLCQASPFSG
jgi:hypothetical protein